MTRNTHSGNPTSRGRTSSSTTTSDAPPHAQTLGLAGRTGRRTGAGQHVHRAGAGAVGLAAPVPLGQLGFLVLGEDALELDQQLVFRGVAARALDELHPDPGPGEFLQQQRLVGELRARRSRESSQDHVQAALASQVPQRLQGRADQGRAGMALVFETHSSGTSSRACSACSRSAAVCDPIVSSFFCRALETRRRSPRCSCCGRPSWPGRTIRPAAAAPDGVATDNPVAA